MEWETLLSKDHFVEMQHESSIADRNDYETIICSTFLRRLQDKAQVFPLDVFLHSRPRQEEILVLFCAGCRIKHKYFLLTRTTM